MTVPWKAEDSGLGRAPGIPILDLTDYLKGSHMCLLTGRTLQSCLSVPHLAASKQIQAVESKALAQKAYTSRHRSMGYKTKLVRDRMHIIRHETPRDSQCIYAGFSWCMRSWRAYWRVCFGRMVPYVHMHMVLQIPTAAWRCYNMRLTFGSIG